MSLQRAGQSSVNRAPAAERDGAALAAAVGGDLSFDADGDATVTFPPPRDGTVAASPAGPFVARWPEPVMGEAMARADAAAPPAPAAAPAEALAAPEIDVEELAEDVLRRLRSQLELDHERLEGRYF
jgi:hypothetical protein